jgi:hypothetical protein
VKNLCLTSICQSNYTNFAQLRDIIQSNLVQSYSGNWWVGVVDVRLSTFGNINQDSVMIFNFRNSNFDFHVHVAIKKWNSVDHTITTEDLQLELLDVSANDEFVDSWSDQTKKKLMSAYLTILRQADILDSKSNELRPLRLMPHEYRYYVECGDTWFLDACLLTSLERENIINYYKTN